tara:strand:- start:236 stop:1429 length:1194 start_codon:yes stop_codon:yes gene_type:complete
MKKLALIFACLISIDALACRFNVRDVGFVDLGSEPYRLFIFVPEGTPTSEMELLESTAYATYLDSNVKASVLSPKDAFKGKAAQFVPRELTQAQAVLVSPDGKQSLPVKLSAEGKPLAVSAWDGLESVFDSERRNSVISKVYEHYCVILIMEGKNIEENQRIRDLANRVVKSISGQMDKLEKEIREPPVVEIISIKDFNSEKAFLWSMGITEISETPQVAILYGRGRMIGPVLRDERLDERSLKAIVNTIGLNCECGLDRKWMQGTMVPQKWDEDLQKRFANQLGFDPESPAIRLEMSQILAKGGKGQGTNRQTPIGGSLDDLLMGYREGSLKEPEAQEPQTSVEQKNTDPEKPITTEVKPTKPPQSRSMIGWIMIAGAPILLAGCAILIFARNKNS